MWKKSTLRFEMKLMAKAKETLAYIHQLTEQVAVEKTLAEPDKLPAELKAAAIALKKKVETLSAQIADAEGSEKRKALRKERSALKKPLKQIADAGYGSDENYLLAVGEENESRFDFLIPYGSYMNEKTRRYKKEIRHASNWTYEELDDRFICPNGRYVRFKKYQTKKNKSELEQSFKIYEM